MIKTTNGFQLLLVVSLLMPLYPRCRLRFRVLETMLLLAPAVAVFTLVSSQTGFNWNLRYVLLAYPFAFIFASRAGCCLVCSPRLVKGTVAVAVTWSVISSLLVYPHSYWYFNEYVGGPLRGHEHLGGVNVDSNIDSGQDLLYLKRWLNAHGDPRPLYIAFNGLYDPALAGIEYERPASAGRDVAYNQSGFDTSRLAPGWYVVSVNHLRSQDGKYQVFLAMRPVDRVGYSIYIYRVR